MFARSQARVLRDCSWPVRGCWRQASSSVVEQECGLNCSNCCRVIFVLNLLVISGRPGRSGTRHEIFEASLSDERAHSPTPSTKTVRTDSRLAPEPGRHQVHDTEIAEFAENMEEEYDALDAEARSFPCCRSRCSPALKAPREQAWLVAGKDGWPSLLLAGHSF